MKGTASGVGLALSIAVGLAGCSDSKPVILPDTRVIDQRNAGEPRLGDLQPKIDVRRVDLPAVDVPTTVDRSKDLVGPKDLTKHLTLTVTDKWYQGGTTCGTPSMDAKVYGPTIDIKLLQIPAAQVQGTCTGHKAEVNITPGLIDLNITGNTGSACWTACWDLSFVIAPVPPGSYQIKYLNLSASVQVSPYSG